LPPLNYKLGLSMSSMNSILDKVLSGGAATGLASGLAGGLAGSFLMSKKGRKFGKSALKVGGVAAVGALAYSAYKKYTNKQNTTTVPDSGVENKQMQSLEDSGFLPAKNDQTALHNLEATLVTAMIAASRADGQMDVQESQAIFKQIKSYQLNAEEEAQLIEQIQSPVDMDALISAATTPEIATEIYTVSVITMNEINSAERDYLSMLAMRLNIPNALVEAIENEVKQDSIVNAA